MSAFLLMVVWFGPIAADPTRCTAWSCERQWTECTCIVWEALPE